MCTLGEKDCLSRFTMGIIDLTRRNEDQKTFAFLGLKRFSLRHRLGDRGLRAQQKNTDMIARDTHDWRFTRRPPPLLASLGGFKTASSALLSSSGFILRQSLEEQRFEARRHPRAALARLATAYRLR